MNIIKNIKDWININRKLGGFWGMIIILFLCISIAIMAPPDEVETKAAFISNKMYSKWGTDYFDKAIINTHKEIIEIEIKQWKDYDDSDAILIISKDGTIYYTNLTNCTLIKSKE